MIRSGLVDTHCHLNMDVFQEDLDQVIENARQAGVRKILIPGLDISSSQRAIQLSRQFVEVYVAVGVHPHSASDWNDSTAEQLRNLAENPKVVAIGEIGLDFYRNLSPAPIQIQCFRDQLSIARELQLPVVVHNREAISEVFDILFHWQATLDEAHAKRPGVLHAFSAGEEDAWLAVNHDFYLGIAGPITFKKAEELRTLVYNLPIERLLIETDSPFLTPAPYRGKRNEPAYVEQIAHKMASIREQDPELIARTLRINAETLFDWSNGNVDSHLF